MTASGVRRGRGVPGCRISERPPLTRYMAPPTRTSRAGRGFSRTPPAAPSREGSGRRARTPLACRTAAPARARPAALRPSARRSMAAAAAARALPPCRARAAATRSAVCTAACTAQGANSRKDSNGIDPAPSRPARRRRRRARGSRHTGCAGCTTGRTGTRLHDKLVAPRAAATPERSSFRPRSARLYRSTCSPRASSCAASAEPPPCRPPPATTPGYSGC